MLIVNAMHSRAFFRSNMGLVSLALVLSCLISQSCLAGSRLGGGRAMGHQRAGVNSAERSGAHGTPSAAPNAAPSAPSAPAQNASPSAAPLAHPVQAPSAPAASSASPVRPGAPAPTAAPLASSSFGGGMVSRMLMGAALGVGIMSLAHAFGGGPEHAEGLMLVVLLVLMGTCAYMVWRFWLKPRSSRGANAYAYADAPGPSFAFAEGAKSAVSPMYNPKNVGNDASARPWETQSTLFSDAPRSQTASARAVLKPFEPQQLGLWEPETLGSSSAMGALPDVGAFQEMAKTHFMALQDAWDRLELNVLASFLTQDMYVLVKAQFAERGAQFQKTEVMMLQAQWLGLERSSGQDIASVELSGMSREAQEASFTPFREIWSWTRPVGEERATWLVCGLEPLQ